MRLLLICAVVLLALALPASPAHGASAHAATGPPPCSTHGVFPYLRTCGPYIEDAHGRPVRLKAVNWYGFEANDFVVAGLDRRPYRPYRAIIALAKRLGYNALRLPFSEEMVERNPVVSAFTASPGSEIIHRFPYRSVQ